MRGSYQDNAMSEISLALAMGFFSIMVLTMVSMGAGFRASPSAQAVILAPSAADAPEAQVIDPAKALIIVYHRGEFLDTDLSVIDPNAIDTDKQVVLAVDPALAMAEVMKIRERVAIADLVISSLDNRWLAALEKRK